MRFLIFFIFFTTNVLSTEVSPSKNIVLTKNLKEYENLSFFDEKKEKEIWINDYKGKIIILNFWASWCAPCKEEMPSLDKLQGNTNLNVKVFPVNVGNDSLEKAKKFFKDTKIQNLNIFFDNSFSLAKKLSLRGVPTSVLFNKEGKEFARVIGVIDFQDQKVTDWLATYN